MDEALRVVFWNAAAEELTERSARRMEGRVLKEVYPPDASLVRRLSETLSMGLSRSETETHIERPDHRSVPVSIVTAPLFDRAGRVEAAVAVVRDLSRIRQLEAEVRRGETLAAAGRMAVGLAHEIRNPLGAIRGAVQLLGRELGASPLSEYTTVLLTEVDRVNRIIETLLDLARPVTIRPVPVNLHQLLERVALLTEESARERRVAIVRRYDPSLPPILGDEDRLVQVFHNLVRNAIEAMAADGGELTLATRVSMNPLFGKVDMGSGQRSMVEVQVLDEGSGIPAAARARIFDPFFTTKERGLGLGLAICHQVMEQHHGAIQIDSVEGHGTTVTCFLPIAR